MGGVTTMRTEYVRFPLNVRRAILWILIAVLVAIPFRGWLSPSVHNPAVIVPTERFPKNAGDRPANAYWFETAWNGETWVFFDDTRDAIFIQTNTEDQHVLDWQEEELGQITSLLPVGEYLLLCTTNGDYQHNLTTNTLEKVHLPIASSEHAFIYENWVVSLWPEHDQVVAYNILSGDKIGLDIYRTGGVTGDMPTQVAYASDSRYLYLSLFLQEKFTFGADSIAVEGTYAINLETWETQCLSEYYYSSLRRANNGLWGGGFVPIRLPDDAP